METAQLFDRYAIEYESKFIQNFLGQYQRQLVHKLMREFLKPHQSLLDIGCGPGSDFAFYKSLDLKVTALDSSRQMVDLAAEKSLQTGLTASVMQMNWLDFNPTETYPAIVLNFGVLNAIPDSAAALKKINAVLQDDGIAFIVVMPRFHLFTIAAKILKIQWRDAWLRLCHGKAFVNGDVEIKYISQRQIQNEFKIIRRVHPGALLPTPDQYNASKVLQKFTTKILKWDRWLASSFPAWFGGDHVCYVVRKK